MKSISKWISVISKALLAISFTFVMIHQITSYSSFASRSAVAFAKETKEPLVESKILFSPADFISRNRDG